MKNTCKIFDRNWKGRDHLGDGYIDGTIILKWIREIVYALLSELDLPDSG
jgi:hypothetical protein